MDSYVTLMGECEGEITVERSRFIAAAIHIDSEQDALDFIAKKRAEYHDAKHNCFAYVLHSGISRSSDDGEPHGTAGKPMLDIIEGSEIYDVCVVVTRYFGGVLLGTGGLVRAYSAATKEALGNAVLVKMQPCCQYSVCCAYPDFDYLAKIISRFGAIEQNDFTDKVQLSVIIKTECENEFLNTVEKTFLDRVQLEKTGEKVVPV